MQKFKSFIKSAPAAAVLAAVVLPSSGWCAINASRIYQIQQRLIDNPRDIESHLTLALEYTEANDLRRAVEVYFNIIKIDRNNFHAYNNLGVLYKKSGQYRDCLQCYDIAEKLDPESPWIPYNKGLCYETMGRMQEAREEYGRALSLAPRFEQALMKLKALSDPSFTLPQLSGGFDEMHLRLPKRVIAESKPISLVVQKPASSSAKTSKKQKPKYSDEISNIKVVSKVKHSHRTSKKGPAAIVFNQALDAFDQHKSEKAIELYTSAIISERELLAEPENGLIKSSLIYLKDKPKRMHDGLFYRGILIFISGNTELAVFDLKNYVKESGNSNKEYLSMAQKLIDQYEAEKKAIADARKWKLEHEALLAAKERAAKSASSPEQPPPSHFMVQKMSVAQIKSEADRLSRESRVTDALAVIESGLKVYSNNLDLLMKSANAYTDLLLIKEDNEAGKMAIKRFQQVYSMTQEGSREHSVARDMIDELNKRIKF